MNSYRVIPYLDEILYSQMARLFDHTLQESVRSWLFNLFNKENYKATIDLPSHLDALYQNYYQFYEPSVDSIINKYTLYPFYESFLRYDKRPRILDSLKSGSGKLIHIIAGINSSDFKRSRYPRYCPQCILESRQQFQESYWKRIYQLPGLLVCPTHNVFINDYVPDLNHLNHSLFIAAERLPTNSIAVVQNYNNTLFAMSKKLEDILNGHLGFDINTINYREKINISPYMKRSCVDYISLIDAMTKFYGVEALNIYFPDYRHPLQWVPSIVRRPKTYFNPIKHLFLFNFLNSIDYKPQLFKDPSWDGLWKCINGACQKF